MKLLDSGALPSCIGNPDPGADWPGPAVDVQDAGVEPEDQSAPDASELAQIQSRTVEEVQQPVVTSRLQTQGAHRAGYAQQLFAGGHSRQTEGHPQEVPVSGACSPQLAHQSPPVIPEHHQPPCRLA